MRYNRLCGFLHPAIQQSLRHTTPEYTGALQESMRFTTTEYTAALQLIVRLAANKPKAVLQVRLHLLYGSVSGCATTDSTAH